MTFILRRLCIVLVGAIVFVVGGFEEDRATRGPGETSDGISRCDALLAPVLMGHVLAMMTSDIEIRVVSRLSVKRGYPVSIAPIGSWVTFARVLPSTLLARHIV